MFLFLLFIFCVEFTLIGSETTYVVADLQYVLCLAVPYFPVDSRDTMQATENKNPAPFDVIDPARVSHDIEILGSTLEESHYSTSSCGGFIICGIFL